MRNPQDKLVTDLRNVVTDAEDLLRATAAQTGEKVQRLGGRIKDAGLEMDNQVREHRWAAIGIAAGAGLLAGLLLSRK